MSVRAFQMRISRISVYTCINYMHMYNVCLTTLPLASHINMQKGFQVLLGLLKLVREN